MAYFNYHATAKSLIKNGKLSGFFYTEKHNGISPALVLIFDDVKHHIMPIRQEKWDDYEKLIARYFK